MSTGPDVQASFVATLVDEWVRSGVTDAVVAPGSRSTPVLAALAADGRIRLHVVLDERSGGFTALGIGLASGRPAPVVTTSGTAAVELHPAVVEAHQAGVPMLVVTADRPAELHHVGAPQTVEQVGLYAGAVRWAVTCGVPDDAAAGTWRSVAARTVADAVAHPSGPGPVHLNLELREPLLGTAGPLPPGRPAGAPWHRLPPAAGGLPSPETVERLASAAGRPGLVVAGGGAPASDLVLGLARGLGWPVLADPRSGCRVPDPLVVGGADTLLRTPAVAALRPATVLRLGRPPASKVLAQWLAGLGPDTTTVVVDPAGAWSDPERTATVVERGDPAALCHAVVERLRSGPDPTGADLDPTGADLDPTGADVDPSGAGVELAGSGGGDDPSAWVRHWADAERAAQCAVDAHLAGLGAPTEPAVARRVLAAAPDGSTLFASSSMPVRDVEWWGAPRTGLTVLANRGANGIDGVLSTAIGVALAGPGPVTCLVGDLAFLYDAGALFGAASRPVSLTVVVVDNDGGGIFSFLPQASALPRERFERLWSTPHGLDLVAVARSYGVAAHAVTDLDALAATVADPAPGIRVLVVHTDRAANVADHAALEQAVAAAVTALPA